MAVSYREFAEQILKRFTCYNVLNFQNSIYGPKSIFATQMNDLCFYILAFISITLAGNVLQRMCAFNVIMCKKTTPR